METMPLPADFEVRLERLQQRVRSLQDVIVACVPYSGIQKVSPFMEEFVDRVYQEARTLLPADTFGDLAALMTTKPDRLTLLDASAVLAVVREAIAGLTPSKGIGFNR